MDLNFTSFDPRTLGTAVYTELSELREKYNQALADDKIKEKDYQSHLKEQKNQAVELYTYLATWGLMRLRGEEIALTKIEKGKPHPDNLEPEKKVTINQEGKREVIQIFFQCLETLSNQEEESKQFDLKQLKKMDTDEYLGLTGLALAIAQEFSFWATVVYYDISSDE